MGFRFLVLGGLDRGFLREELQDVATTPQLKPPGSQSATVLIGTEN